MLAVRPGSIRDERVLRWGIAHVNEAALNFGWNDQGKQG
jgi:hypothetical protein